ncbi:hypothetical protein ACQCVP_16005 [Rossellomorea vietnamensis]|uniref:hypothetical protein n=1 Tax=Rossellomorea vietnamensis TaxID=218284 RepID=UPI003CFA4B7F
MDSELFQNTLIFHSFFIGTLLTEPIFFFLNSMLPVRPSDDIDSLITGFYAARTSQLAPNKKEDKTISSLVLNFIEVFWFLA